MSLDHDIPTHLDVADRPALGLTTPQLLLLAGGVLVGLGTFREPHTALALRLVEGLAPAGVALLLVVVRPAGQSLVAWTHAALAQRTSPRRFVWISTRAAPPSSAHGATLRPPHVPLPDQDDHSVGAPPTAPPAPRHGARYAATQTRPFVPWEIADNTVIFRDGHRCAVLECSGTTTTLLDEGALRATHAAYHAFLVGLPWPLQMLVWASPVDLRAHVAAREARLAGLPLALREVESADVGFMRREARRLGLLDHRFFVVIPAPDQAGRSVPTASLLAAVQARFHTTRCADSDNAVAAVLDERCERTIANMAASGVHAWRLSTEGLRALWYRLLVPRGARAQPFDPGHADAVIRPQVTFPRHDADQRHDGEGHDA